MEAPAVVPFALPAAACLPVERAFVLHLALGPDGAPLQGRVEHVLTGRRADFASLADLQNALARCQPAVRS